MERTKLSRLIALAFLSSGIAVGGSAYSASGVGTNSGPAVKERGQQVRTDKAAQQGDRQWASDLIGKNVAIAGDRKGEIKDLIVNAETGEVGHAVTEISGGKGPDRLYAVPLQMFKFGADNKLMLAVDQNWLSQHKSWTKDKWPGMQDREYWGESGSAGSGGGSARAGGASLHRVRKLVGEDVENAQGKEVGEIKDVVVNLKSQKADFVLLDYDPGVTKAGKEYAMPLTAFKFPATTADGGEGKKRIVFNMNEDKIKGMKPLERADKKRIIHDPNFMSGTKSK
jgi:sporulation protein YlmC with PRC-barrel domain